MSHAMAKVILIYGESGLFKTTNAMFGAKWLFARTGKPIRLVSAEASTLKIFESLIETGIVQSIFLQGLVNPKNPLPCLRHLMAGEWPTPDGKGWAKATGCGGYVFEGLTTFSEMIMEDLREKQRQIGEDVVGKFEEGCTCGISEKNLRLPDKDKVPHLPGCPVEKFANAGRSHYNFVQSEMLRHVKVSGGLSAPYVIWTAHEAASEDEDTRAPIRGPALVGKKRVGSDQKYVSTLLHAEGYSTQVKGKDGLTHTEQSVRVWFQRHPDTKYPNIEYPAKTTVPPERVGELLAKFPGGYFTPTPNAGLDTFLEAEARLAESTTSNLAAWRDSILAKFPKTA